MKVTLLRIIGVVVSTAALIFFWGKVPAAYASVLGTIHGILFFGWIVCVAAMLFINDKG